MVDYVYELSYSLTFKDGCQVSENKVKEKNSGEFLSVSGIFNAVNFSHPL